MNPHAEEQAAGPGASLPIMNAQTAEVLMRAPTPGVMRLNRKKVVEVFGTGVDVQVKAPVLHAGRLKTGSMRLMNRYIVWQTSFLFRHDR